MLLSDAREIMAPSALHTRLYVSALKISVAWGKRWSDFFKKSVYRSVDRVAVVV